MESPHTSESRSSYRILYWIGWVLTGLIVALLLMSGVTKLMGGQDLAEGFEKLGLPPAISVPLAIVEIAAALLYLLPPTSVLGAILVTGYMGGAICTHWRVGDPVVVQTLVGVIAWLGVYLREPRLWTILPWRFPQ